MMKIVRLHIVAAASIRFRSKNVHIFILFPEDFASSARSILVTKRWRVARVANRWVTRFKVCNRAAGRVADVFFYVFFTMADFREQYFPGPAYTTISYTYIVIIL